ncbi:hypothetical protein B0H10DRAFT_1379876 [Mycena sp. CBHHK59/15]|nr:hypothetical protein B0H10DRAFT_1379876 [Mycena sp. CBHHK59/15]
MNREVSVALVLIGLEDSWQAPMDQINQDEAATDNVLPISKLWNAARKVSRQLFVGDHWTLPFFRSLSPIDRLPPDILGEIFSWALDDNQSMEDRRHLLLEPLTLSHVSSRWRAAALSKPTLWSTIWVDRPRAVHVPMVKLWLENSRGCPLALCLRQSPSQPPQTPQTPQTPADPPEHAITDEILLLFIAHLFRWKKILFSFRTVTQRSLLTLPDLPKAAPLLEHVQMKVDSWDPVSARDVQRIMYSYVSVRIVALDRHTALTFVPWAQLTHLDARTLHCPIDWYLKVFMRCPSLRSAVIMCSRNPDDHPFVTPPLCGILRHLSSFTVSAHRVDLGPLFDALILPKLESLTIVYSSAPRQSDDPQALHRLLGRSGVFLKRFSLKDITATTDDERHLSYLRHHRMDSLIDLFMDVDMTDKIINFLIHLCADDGGALTRPLPHIQTMTLKDFRGEHITDLTLYSMVISRLGTAGLNTNDRYPGALRAAEFYLRLKGHYTSPVLPFLVERCRDYIDLRINFLPCEDPHARVGRYTSSPLAGGYLIEG